MAPPACTVDEFRRIWTDLGASPHAVARELGIDVRGVYRRREYLETLGYELPTRPNHHATPEAFAYRPRVEHEIRNGCAIVWNDRHKWPGDGVSHAEAALLALIPQLRPALLVCNGDVLDGARITRHPPLGWESKPGTADEVAAVQEHMGRIEAAASGFECALARTTGNHDLRYDRHLATHAGDFKGLVGMRLSDHLPRWSESWSVHINEGIPGGHTVVKHRIRNGVTAGRANAVAAGVTIVTGHTHKQDVVPVRTYSGTHYGVQTGMLADLYQPAHEYAEDHPDPGQPGFAVLTWREHVLQPPELATTDDAGVTWFRGQPIRVRVRVKAGSAAA